MTAAAARESIAWQSIEEVLREVESSPEGLTSAEAARRRNFSPRSPHGHGPWVHALLLLGSQFQSPLTLLLIGSAILSWSLQDSANAAIILGIVVASGCLGFWQEFSAAHALAALLALVSVKVVVVRDGKEVEVPDEDIVVGDVILLSAGSSVPGDCRLLESRDLHMNESALTGETFPVEKQAGDVAPNTPLTKCGNVVFEGSHAVSGTALAVVLRVGEETELGAIGERLEREPAETDFERGIREFGSFLVEVTLLLVALILAIHLALQRPILESLLFALALAVGLTPQLLPAIIAVNLSQGASRLAQRKVVVRRLASIENFGSMTLLCSDKTGTLTEGKAHIEGAVDLDRHPHPKALRWAWLNATLETGFVNPIDLALREDHAFSLGDCEKLDEIPYDFLRKRISILVREGGERLLIVKGDCLRVLSLCARSQSSADESAPIEDARRRIEATHRALAAEGFRALAIAVRKMEVDRITRDDERDLTFLGFLLLRDRPKPDAADSIAELERLGIAVKIITGDNRFVAAATASHVGLRGENLLTGEDLRHMSDEALVQRAEETDVFAEIEPNQKERIILALRRGGEVVGFLGDGINDATALHAADVGISVDGAVDVAKEAADIVLLEQNLGVLAEGVREGRAVFANTLKYVFMATSANFGNMFSMAGASLFLPFLPLLPRQILLTNLLTDLPEMTLAQDSVDSDQVARPQRWDIAAIRRFMLWFGVLSSLFDYATFAVLLLLFQVGETAFRTGWFVESVVSACAVVLVVRTRQPFWSSMPSTLLAMTTWGVIAITVAVPYSPFAEPLGFARLPIELLLGLLLIVAVYLASAEALKRWYFATAR